MLRRIRHSLALALVLILALTMSALGQGEEPSCRELADQEGGGPALQIAQEGTADFVVSGCNFRAGESVRVEARLKLGDGAWTQLDPVDVDADSDGAFEATFTSPGGAIDYSAGYHFEATATRADGSAATAGTAGIAGGGMPLPPETGAGALSGAALPDAGAMALVLAGLGAYTIGRSR